MGYRMDKEEFFSSLHASGYKSLMDFAHRTGIHRNTLGLYLSGREILQGAFMKIADALHCDPMELVQKVTDAETRVQNLSEIRPLIDHILSTDSRIAVMLIGSRAKGTAKKYADWDVGITRGSVPIEGSLYLRLCGEIDDLADDLVRHVDLVNLDAAPAWFLSGFDYEPIFIDGDRESFAHFMGVIHGIRKGQAA